MRNRRLLLFWLSAALIGCDIAPQQKLALPAVPATHARLIFHPAANSVPAVIWPSKTPNTVLASVTAPTSELMTASFGLFCRFPRQRGRFEFIPRFLGLQLRRSREAGESLGRVDIREDAVAVHLDLDDQPGMGGDHVAGADIPGNARELREEAARQPHGDAALRVPGRHANTAAFERVEGGDEAVDLAGGALWPVAHANHRPLGPGLGPRRPLVHQSAEAVCGVR